MEHNYISDTFNTSSVLYRTMLCALKHARYLAKCALNLPEEVIVWHLWCGIIHVIDGKLQLLNLLKVVVELESTGELWTQAVLDILRSTDLKTSETQLLKCADCVLHTVSTASGPGPGPLQSNITSVQSRNIFWIRLGPCVAFALLFLFISYKPHFTSVTTK